MKKEEIEKSSYKGVKIGLVGCAIAFTGFYIEYYTCAPVATISMLIGFSIVVFGGYIHYKLFFKELNTDPKELYKAPKQPWEKDD